MTVLRVIVTALDLIFMLIFLYFLRGLTWEKNKASVVGFGSLELVFLLNLLLIWTTR